MYSNPTTSEILQFALLGISIIASSAFCPKAAEPSSSTTWTRSTSSRRSLYNQSDFSGGLAASRACPNASFNSCSLLSPAGLSANEEPTARLTTTFMASPFASSYKAISILLQLIEKAEVDQGYQTGKMRTW